MDFPILREVAAEVLAIFCAFHASVISFWMGKKSTAAAGGSLVGRYDGTRRAEAGGDREGKSVVCAAVAWRRCRVKLMDLCCTMTLFTAEMLRERSSEAVV